MLRTRHLSSLVRVDATARFAWTALRRLQHGLINGQLPAHAATAIDIRENQLTVRTSAAIKTSTRSVIARAAGRMTPAIRYRVQPSLANGSHALSCGLNSVGEPGCDPPLRGGIKIVNADTGDVCTAGVNVQSTVDNRRYMLTAGHCLKDAEKQVWRAQLASGAGYSFGSEWRFNYAPSVTRPTPADWGIIGIKDTVTRDDTLLVLPVARPRRTTYNENYDIQRVGTSAPMIGQYLCITGASGGTSCGILQGIGATYNGLSQLGYVDFQSEYGNYACHGDSGGPVYAGGSVYGLVSAGDFEIPGYRRPNGATCYIRMYFVGLTGALRDLNVRLNTE